MKAISLFLLLLLMSPTLWAQNVPSSDSQIKTAVLAAPEEFREGAKVYGYDSNGEWTVLREGSNEIVCIASDPKREGFSASCYHKDLEPFMERGRELSKEGKAFQEIFDIREKEVKEGKLEMPKDGVTLFVLSADKEDYEPEKGEVRNTNFRYVVYIPFATVESTGLPLKPQAPGMPWIMDPGTHRAHIMITPPPRDKE